MAEFTNFGKETWDAFKADDRPGPIHMLNLIRLREKAVYPDGRVKTGEEAYREYSRISAPVLKRLGGSIVWRAGFEMMMVGPDQEKWDVCFVAEYPSVGAFTEMMRDPIYREAMGHRQAAVEDSRLVRLIPRLLGDEFADPATHSV